MYVYPYHELYICKCITFPCDCIYSYPRPQVLHMQVLQVILMIFEPFSQGSKDIIRTCTRGSLHGDEVSIISRRVIIRLSMPKENI